MNLVGMMGTTPVTFGLVLVVVTMRIWSNNIIFNVVHLVKSERSQKVRNAARGISLSCCRRSAK